MGGGRYVCGWGEVCGGRRGRYVLGGGRCVVGGGGGGGMCVGGGRCVVGGGGGMCVCVLIFVMGTCIVMIVYKCDNSQLTFQWFALEIVCSVVIVPCSVTQQCAY